MVYVLSSHIEPFADVCLDFFGKKFVWQVAMVVVGNVYGSGGLVVFDTIVRIAIEFL